MDSFLEINESGKSKRIKTKVFEDVSSIKPLINENSWKILQLLHKKPMYPAQIAKTLKLPEQKVYYYIKQLRNASLIEVSKTEELQGALAKYYTARFDSFALLPSFENIPEEKHSIKSKAMARELSPEIKEFFSPFITNSVLDTKIIVGSPDPHGKFKARARDSHFAADLTAFLSSLASEINFPLIFLDTSISSLETENSNLIIVGGPITNKLTQELNDSNKLPIQFIPFGGRWIMKSIASGKEYTEDSLGVIQKIPHPFFPGKSILLIAGNRSVGTRAAILSLIKNLDEIIKPNQFSKEIHARIMEGLDIDGDGLIDDIEIKE